MPSQRSSVLVYAGAANWFAEGFGELSFTHTGLPPLDMAGALLLTLPPLAPDLFNLF